LSVPNAVLERRQPAVELVLSMGVTLTFVAGAWKVGFFPTIFALLLLLGVLLGFATPRGYAFVILMLAPLPAIGELVGATVPLGLDPLDVMVVVGCAVMIQQSRRQRFLGRRVTGLVVVSLAIFVFQWYRTYGADAFTGSAAALLIKPVIVLLAGITLVNLLGRSNLAEILGSGMAAVLFLVGMSVVLQRVGLYHTAHQVAYEESLGAKQYGGLMLDGNSLGALFGIFAVPTYVLLAANGRRWAVITLVFAVPILLISLSRSGIAAFFTGLVALALLDRQRMRGARIVVIVGVGAAIWAATLGREQIVTLRATLTGYSYDPNAALSGRAAIWRQARNFLNDGHHWLFGGGLDSFRDYALSSPLHHAFATHNLYLRLLTNGGVLMALAFVALVIGLWMLGRSAQSPEGLALRIALASMLVLGLTLDFDIFSRLSVWLWVLAAASSHPAMARSTAAKMRSVIPSIPQGRNGARISSRILGELEST